MAKKNHWLERIYSGYSLADIPLECRDRNICLVAAQQDGRNIFHVPKELLDREICLASLSLASFRSDPEICLFILKNWDFKKNSAYNIFAWLGENIRSKANILPNEKIEPNSKRFNEIMSIIENMSANLNKKESV